MSTSTERQGKTELNVSSHQQKDKDKSGDYAMHGTDKDKEKTKHEKTSITFERKKCDDKSCQDKSHEHNWSKDKEKDKDKEKEKEKELNKEKKEFHYEKDLSKDKDLHKDKDWSKEKKEYHYESKDLNKDKEMHDKNEENKGSIINTIKEKVKDVLGSGDNDKSKDKDKDVHMTDEYNKTAHDKFGSSTVGVGSGSAQPASHLGTTSGSTYHSNLGTTGTSNLGATGTSNLGGASNVAVDKPYTSGPSGVGAGYSSTGYPTVDHRNLGAEHREVGYDKQSNVIPSKEKEKDTVHKVDVHGSLYTSGAGSTFKTNEAK